MFPGKALAIVAICIAAAIGYGVVHDQITARICIEYFTIGHAHIGTESPTLVGLYWGVVATWWVGAGLGVPLALVARAGGAAKIEPRKIVRPVLILLAVTAAAAVLAGFVGWYSATQGAVRLVGSIRNRVPEERHLPYLVALWVHSASYGVGAVGGVGLIGYMMGVRGERRRGRRGGVAAGLQECGGQLER